MNRFSIISELLKLRDDKSEEFFPNLFADISYNLSDQCNMITLPASRKDRLVPRDTVITKRQLEKLSRIKLLLHRPYGLHIPFCRTAGKISGPLRHPLKQAVMDIILYPAFMFT